MTAGITMGVGIAVPTGPFGEVLQHLNGQEIQTVRSVCEAWRRGANKIINRSDGVNQQYYIYLLARLPRGSRPKPSQVVAVGPESAFRRAVLRLAVDPDNFDPGSFMVRRAP